MGRLAWRFLCAFTEDVVTVAAALFWAVVLYGERC